MYDLADNKAWFSIKYKVDFMLCAYKKKEKLWSFGSEYLMPQCKCSVIKIYFIYQLYLNKA